MKLTEAELETLRDHLAWFCDPYESREFASLELKALLARIKLRGLGTQIKKHKVRKAK